MPRENPTVIVKNNTGADVPVQLFQYGGIPSSNNATRQFRYATPASVFVAASMVSIQVRSSSSQPYRTYSAPVATPTPQAVVEALNGLNLGTSWYTKEIGGDTYILTDNDSLEFGDLVLSAPDQYNLEVQTQFPDVSVNFSITADGTLIYSATGPDPDLVTENIDIVPGAEFLVQFSVNLAPLESVQLTVLKLTSSGFDILVIQSLINNESFQFPFTSEDDATGYVIACVRID